MARGYGGELRARLVELLAGSRTGMSGVEISAGLGVSRVTMSKYLRLFAAEGLIRGRDAGGATLWTAEEGAGRFRFPDDYDPAQRELQDALLSYSEARAYALARSILRSGAGAARAMTEIVMPTAAAARKMYDDGRIGATELAMLEGVLSGVIHVFALEPADADPRRTAVLVAADAASALACQAAGAALRQRGWSVLRLGDMSASADALFDLDLQKLLGRAWKRRPGVLAAAVFSESDAGLRFFAGAARAAGAKAGRRARVVLCGPAAPGSSVASDAAVPGLEGALAWFESAA